MRLRSLILTMLVCSLPLCAQAQAPKGDPEAINAAKELITVMQATDQLKKMIPLIMQQLKPAIVQNRPDVEKDFDAALPTVLDAMNARMGEFVDSVAAIYAANFSADELRQVTTFYRSPVGQKFIANLPAIMQQSMAVGQKFGQDIAGDMRARMIEELRKKGHDNK